MPTKFTLLILLLSCSAYRAIGQSDGLLQFSVGPSFLTRQDLVFSPFIHTDFSLFNGGLEYQCNKRGHQFFRMNYAGFETGLQTPYDYIFDDSIATAYPHDFTFAQIAYGHGFSIGKRDTLRPTAGFAVQMDIQAMTYQYGRFSFFGYYSTTALNVWYRHTFPIGNKSRIIGMVEAPLVSWLTRSPYLVNDDDFIENTYSHNGFETFFEYLADGHIATWDEVQRVDLGLQYQYDLSRTWAVGAAYKFSFIHASEPRDLYSIQNNFNLTLGFKL